MTNALAGSRRAVAALSRATVLALLNLLMCAAGMPVARATSVASLPSLIGAQLAKAVVSVRFRVPDRGARHALGAIYADDANQPLWSVNGQPSAQALRLMEILRDARAYGLEPADYGTDALWTLERQACGSPAGAPQHRPLWARFDIELTVAALRLVGDLHYGRVTAQMGGLGLPRPRRTLDWVSIVRLLAHSAHPRRSLAAIQPAFYPYRLLEIALGRYRQLAAEDAALTHLPLLGHRPVRPGGHYAGAPALRRLLHAVGDLPPGAEQLASGSDVDQLDLQLVSALERFQRRHGLAPDGILGPATFRQLTTPFAQRVRQIALNLERWRWLPELHAPLIMVNVPQFRLFAFQATAEAATDTIQMGVIVGRTRRGAHTPEFVSEVKTVIFRPYWNVPRRITVQEMLPDIRRKPNFLSAQHLQIVRGYGPRTIVLPPSAVNLAALAAGELRLRQLPGPSNALGLIKFLVPNPYDVYLHSTPARWLFTVPRRAYSHGCIRVSDPVALATFVLRRTPGEWTGAKIEAAMDGPDDRHVEVAEPVRVIVVYQTAFATAGGEVLFFPDLYDRDRKLERLLGLAPMGFSTARTVNPLRAARPPRSVSRCRAPGVAYRRDARGGRTRRR